MFKNKFDASHFLGFKKGELPANLEALIDKFKVHKASIEIGLGNNAAGLQVIETKRKAAFILLCAPFTDKAGAENLLEQINPPPRYRMPSLVASPQSLFGSSASPSSPACPSTPCSNC